MGHSYAAERPGANPPGRSRLFKYPIFGPSDEKRPAEMEGDGSFLCIASRGTRGGPAACVAVLPGECAVQPGCRRSEEAVVDAGLPQAPAESESDE